jgi:hypothetical protein
VRSKTHQEKLAEANFKDQPCCRIKWSFAKFLEEMKKPSAIAQDPKNNGLHQVAIACIEISPFCLLIDKSFGKGIACLPFAKAMECNQTR